MNIINAKTFNTMKIVFYIILFTSLYFNIAKSEPLLLTCKNTENSEPRYFLTIDLDNKTLEKAEALYKIIEIKENSIKAERRINIDNKKYIETIFLDRYYGKKHLITTKRGDIKWEVIEAKSFQCNKYPVF